MRLRRYGAGAMRALTDRLARVAVGVLVALVAPVGAAAQTRTFSFTGASQTWTVPPGVTTASFELLGAAGQGNVPPFSGGLGGRAVATVALTPGTSVQVNVGGAGLLDAGGFNGGGDGRFGGGGATDVRVGGTGLADRALVAGGGGGAAVCTASQATAAGGAGGGAVGGDGEAVANSACRIANGTGATASGSGTSGPPGTSGGPGQGGAGAGGGSGRGGGGGGGLFGGGGGSGDVPGNAGAGGGGSGFGPPGATLVSGVRAGDGLAEVTYAPVVHTLTAAVAGQGVVSSDPAGLACPSTCAASFPAATAVTLTAAPAPGWAFAGWTGACSGVGACVVPLDDAREVGATFTVVPVASPQPGLTPPALAAPPPRAAVPAPRRPARPRTCRSRRDIPVNVALPRRARVLSLRATVAGRRARARRVGRRVIVAVDLRGRLRQRYTVSILVRLRGGRVIRAKRAFRTCEPRRAGARQV